MRSILKRALILSVMCLLTVSVFANGNKEAEAKSEKVVLNWWTWTIPTVEDFAVIKKGFEAKYPNIELISSVNQMDDYKTKLQTEFASGAGPDILCVQPGSLLNKYNSFLMDLEEPAKDTLVKLVPAVVQDAKKRSGGDKISMAPLGSASTMFVYYNATYFEEAGITEVPTDLASLKSAISKLRTTFPDKLPLTIGLKDSWFNGDVFSLFANMVEPGITELADNGLVKWNSSKFVEAMELLKMLVDEGVIEKDALGVAVYEDSIGMWADGKAVMHINGGWAIGMLSNPSNVNAEGTPYADRRGGRATDNDVFGAFPVPNFAGGNPVVLGGIDVGIAVNKNVEKDPAKLDAAMKLLDYMLVGEGREYQTGRPGAGLIPTLMGASLNKSIYQDEASSKGVDAIVEATNYNMAAPRGVQNPAVFTQMGIVVQNVVSGNDIQQELDALQLASEK
ncbi:carbohydrate ABC transporter substrate-binding protein [Thiospirochaeta perfilievii]|uniref:Carbohydrate ABC transporter substrate-binding protein n=1 Tax=Thiospirochaeta perfilievii TaxID=252967 RepID=A0A5C1QBB1_9SPIO|nr:ABC transporter substrate-binding protein [Thiospirochaeta perfilievii]QEN04658.1 carbohydrate ABC transporter substrate-binding protein [Thiospirochaeta perfilievii]